MDNPKFQIKKDAAGEFRFNLRAKNGEIILRSSEGYVTKQGCLGGIAAVRINAPLDNRYDSRYNKDFKNGQYYFVLHAANYETLGISETYYSTAGRDNGIAAVKNNAPIAPIEDLTLVKV